MSETTVLRSRASLSGRARLAALRVAGLLVLIVSLVLPATRAAEVLGLRQQTGFHASFDQLGAPVADVMINAPNSWVEVVRAENPSAGGSIWLQQSCVVPSAAGPGFETIAHGRLQVLDAQLTGWEQTFRRCETWVHVFVDQRMTVRVWDGAQAREIDTGLDQWVVTPEGRVITTPR